MGSPYTGREGGPFSPQLEKAHAQQRRPSAAKNNPLILKERTRERLTQGKREQRAARSGAAVEADIADHLGLCLPLRRRVIYVRA